MVTRSYQNSEVFGDLSGKLTQLEVDADAASTPVEGAAAATVALSPLY